MSFLVEVSPAALRRAAGALSSTGEALAADLTRAYFAVAADRPVHPGWSTTTAVAALVTAASEGLAMAADQIHDGADNLVSAAAGYERCDDDAGARLHALIRPAVRLSTGLERELRRAAGTRRWAGPTTASTR